MKIVVIIQARMGSSRLPGKILMPLGETDNLTYVTSRCRKIKGISDVIVATSTLSQDDIVQEWCESHNISCYRGSEDNVLDRFIQAAKFTSPDYVIRVTADCPFVDYEIASDMVEMVKDTKVDIIDLGEVLPRGLAVEVISYSALQYIQAHGHEERHREHVTYYAYEFKEQFTRNTYYAPNDRLHPQLRVTLDTPEDYELIKIIADHFQDVYVPSQDVLQFLLENPEIARINENIEQKPVV